MNTTVRPTPNRAASAVSVLARTAAVGTDQDECCIRQSSTGKPLDEQVQSFLPGIQPADEHEHVPITKPRPAVIERVGSGYPHGGVGWDSIRHDDNRTLQAEPSDRLDFIRAHRVQESGFVQIASLDQLAEQNFLQAAALQGLGKECAMDGDAVWDPGANEVSRQRDVSRYVDRVKMNDVRRPCDNILGQGLVTIAGQQPMPERAERVHRADVRGAGPAPFPSRWIPSSREKTATA